MGGLSCVALIPGASQAVVLSDIGTAATERAGKLKSAFVRRRTYDREPFRAMRPLPSYSDRKFLSRAPLFTVRGGELPRALPPARCITVENVPANLSEHKPTLGL